MAVTFTVLISISCERSAPPPQEESARVCREELIDEPLRLVVRRDLVVPATVTLPDLHAILLEELDVARTRQSERYKRAATSVLLYAYPSKEHALGERATWMAMIHWRADSGKAEFTPDENAIRAASLPPEERFGLSEAVRISIYRRTCDAFELATRRAESEHPIPKGGDGYSRDEQLAAITAQAQAQPTIRDRLYQDIADDFHLSLEQLNEIRVEAFKKNWP
ncbi:MAG: hypothetical protein ACKVXR_15505 [Planctomycetota bacterium]